MSHDLRRIDQVLDNLLTPLDDAKFAEIVQAMRACTSAVNDGEGNIDACLQQLSELTGRRFEASLFFEIWGWTSEENLAQTLGSTSPDPIYDLTRDEIAKALECYGNAPIEIRERVVEFLELCLPGNFNSDLIYYPYRVMSYSDLADEIVHRRAIIQEGGIAALELYELDTARDVAADPSAKPWALQWALPKVYPEDRARQNEILKRCIHRMKAH